MAFDTSVITEVFPPVFRAGGMLLEWTSSAPPGTWYQVYVGGRLAWYGQDLTCTLDPPRGHEQIDIGAVDEGEQTTDFGASLSPFLNRATLTWSGGPGLAPDLAGFRVYGEASPGGGISYATPLADLPAIEQGRPLDGFGLGGFGDPVFGSIAGSYTWTSAALTSGTWNFAVRTYDAAGNEANGSIVAVEIGVPPRPPALDARNRRLTYTYSEVTHQVTLNWLASPDIP